MSVSLESLGIDKLSIEDRLELVHAIWNSIAISNGLPTMSEELGRELDRRIAEDEASPDDVVDWVDVKAAAMKRLSS